MEGGSWDPAQNGLPCEAPTWQTTVAQAVPSNNLLVRSDCELSPNCCQQDIIGDCAVHSPTASSLMMKTGAMVLLLYFQMWKTRRSHRNSQAVCSSVISGNLISLIRLLDNRFLFSYVLLHHSNHPSATSTQIAF